ncbi:MAG TPA: HD domain-containing protein [Actinomycetota bacterium]|nr:HD domain-containing protein [Actinomycetota bacterium]
MQAYSPGHHGRWSARRRADLVDEAVRGLADGLGPGVALVALGGYGRGQLCPRSDVDLMVLHRGEYPDAMFETASRVFYPFWDAGISLGHAVRTVGESVATARERVDALTALLDARLVSGDRELFDRLEVELSRVVAADRAGLLEQLRRAGTERRSVYGSCSQLLEPDLKESAGGLRDIHLFGWAGRVLGSASQAELVGSGLLREREVAALDEAEEFLVRLRSTLHLETGRRTDRVPLELQPRLAEAFGFDAAAGLAAPDALMRTLFEHARAVEHISEAFLDRCAARIGGGPAHLEVDGPTDPEEVLRAFAGMAETGMPLGPAALDSLEDAIVGVPRWTDGMRDAFLSILRAGADGARALEAMDRAGLLSRFLPEWEAVRCRPQRDPYHRFSVDVHLLQTVTGVAWMLAGETGDDPLAREAASAIDDRNAILLGAFLHDIGKVGEGSHVPKGVEVAASALSRMGVPDSTAASVLFLVQQHLLLSDTATRRDASDQNLVLDVAARVQDPQRLAMLYVLTVADALATGPHAWTAWRQALVRELVARVERVLQLKEMGPDQAVLLARRIDQVRALLGGEHPPAVETYLPRLPRTYLLATEPAAVARHFNLVAPAIGASEVRTQAGPGERAGTYEVTVVARDRPGLLSLIAGALAVGGMNILSARAFTTEDGVAVDLFVVEPAFQGEIDEERWRRFRTDLRRALEGRISLDHRIREKRTHYPPPSADVPVQVTVDNDTSDFYTIVEVSASDRIGLLFDLARALHGLQLDVHLAVVATYGVRVVDAFYVRDLIGEKVVEPERISQIEAAIKDRLAARST